MQIKFFCPHWGSESLPFEEFLHKVKSEGYDGVEMSLPLDKNNFQEVVQLLENYELLLIGQHWETVERDISLHMKEYESRLYHLAEAKPLFINSQTGKDYYSFGQNESLIKRAAEIEKSTGVKIVHETHRGKFSFAAHVCKGYLEAIPELQLCLDVSHWCNTAETFLYDQEEAVDLAIERTFHIHSRVGHTQGPQVTDPRCEEWQEALQRHLFWWDKVVNKFEAQGSELLTITTEFGPSPYMVQLPGSNESIASQWDINVFMKNLLKHRYASLSK